MSKTSEFWFDSGLSCHCRNSLALTSQLHCLSRSEESLQDRSRTCFADLQYIPSGCTAPILLSTYQSQLHCLRVPGFVSPGVALGFGFLSSWFDWVRVRRGYDVQCTNVQMISDWGAPLQSQSQSFWNYIMYSVWVWVSMSHDWLIRSDDDWRWWVEWVEL